MVAAEDVREKPRANAFSFFSVYADAARAHEKSGTGRWYCVPATLNDLPSAATAPQEEGNRRLAFHKYIVSPVYRCRRYDDTRANSGRHGQYVVRQRKQGLCQR